MYDHISVCHKHRLFHNEICIRTKIDTKIFSVKEDIAHQTPKYLDNNEGCLKEEKGLETEILFQGFSFANGEH